MKERVQNWLKEAKWDLENANILLENKRYSTAVFHSQQASEKAVKALLFSRNLNGWGHSINSLLEKYSEEEKRQISTIQNEARELDRNYITTRYPDALPEIAPQDAYDKIDAEKSINQANKIFYFVESEINYFKLETKVKKNK